MTRPWGRAAALMFAVHGLAKAIGYWPALAAVIPVSIAAQALAVRALRRGPALQSGP